MYTYLILSILFFVFSIFLCYRAWTFHEKSESIRKQASLQLKTADEILTSNADVALRVRNRSLVFRNNLLREDLHNQHRLMRKYKYEIKALNRRLSKEQNMRQEAIIGKTRLRDLVVEEDHD